MTVCVLAGISASGSAQAQVVATRPASSEKVPTTQPTAGLNSTSAPSTAAAPKRRTYTAPGPSVRGASLGLTAAALSLGATATPASTGKELSESAFSTSSRRGDLAGRPGLEASPSRVANAVNSQGNIGRVSARSGLGFAGPNTLLTARPNPLSGPNGVGQRLGAAGFDRSSIAGVRSFAR